MPCNVPGGVECAEGTVCSETDPAATGAECVGTPREPTCVHLVWAQSCTCAQAVRHVLDFRTVR